jgi:type I restriction enzyme S subunit
MVELIGGGTPKKSESDYWDGDIAWFSVKDAPADGDVFVIDTELKITELGLNKSSTKLLPKGVTIISARGTVGRLALVGVPTAMNQSCYGVKGIDGIDPYLNYFNLKEAVSTLQQNTHGAVFDTITRDTFDTVFLVDASGSIKIEFERAVEDGFKKIRNNLFENKSLESLRDSLLPKLLAGELDLDSNQTELEEAV